MTRCTRNARLRLSALLVVLSLASCATPRDRKTYQVEITTSPPGAEVYSGTQYLGVTPCKVPIEFDGERTPPATPPRWSARAPHHGDLELHIGESVIVDSWLGVRGLGGGHHEATVSIVLTLGRDGYHTVRFQEALPPLTFDRGPAEQVARIHRVLEPAPAAPPPPREPGQARYPSLAVAVEPPAARLELLRGGERLWEGPAASPPTWTAYVDEGGLLYTDRDLQLPIDRTLHYTLSAEGYWPASGVLQLADRAGVETPLAAALVPLQVRRVGIQTLAMPLGGAEGLGSYVADLITSYLADEVFLSVLERSQVDRFFQERGLETSDIFDDERRTEFGFIDADYLVVGSIREAGAGVVISARIARTATGEVVIGVVEEGDSIELAARVAAAKMAQSVRASIEKEDRAASAADRDP